MILRSLGNRKRIGYTTWGCMWEMGKCVKETGFILKNKAGEEVSMQSRITAYWPDGSVKWTAHTADAALLGEEIEVLPGKETTVSDGKEEKDLTGKEGKDPAEKEEKDLTGKEGECLVGKEEKALSGKSGKTMESRQGILVQRDGGRLKIRAGSLEIEIPEDGAMLFDSLSFDGKVYLTEAKPVLLLEEPSLWEGNPVRIVKNYRPRITEVGVEEEGALQVIIKFTGHHELADGEQKIPFLIRMKIGFNSPRLDFVHTFIYDGDEDRDFLKGLGIGFRSPLKGKIYNRHVKFMGDHGVFHESMAQLLSWRPRVPQEIYTGQMKGQLLELKGTDKELVDRVLEAMPFWSEYDLCQDSVNHFSVRKKIKDENCCYLDCLHGSRTAGGAAFGSERGSVLFSVRDFWEKYPSGYTFRNLDGESAEAVMWLWSPKAEAMDFRHYANRGYNQVYYEGYDYKGATPYGIACTSECSVLLSGKMIPEDEEIEEFTETVNRPVRYIGTPEYYHKLKAFGYWSLPERKTQMENWLEDQLDRAVGFYTAEVGQRNWYGMFNYGDFMHTYDRERHQWRYDMGGYAWDNTELVPTLWLWYAFMRTGREDTFILAEKLSRHTSEVDVYHMGRYKGLGSRHNVRHWGCPCKEARIAMAAHHRFYYYLTGDRRLEEIFEELKDNEMTFLNKDPLGDFYEKETMVYPSHARSGPDWSSLCANWMTRWERFDDKKYRDKIITGIEDIKKAPLKLISGPDFEFDPGSVHLRYIGERAAGGTHLQVCMGSPEVWMELSELLGDEEWKKMMADYGRFYYLPREEQLKESDGIIGEREFSLPFMAAAMGAYGAWYLKDEKLAEVTWRHLLHTLIKEGNHDGFKTEQVADKGNRKELTEIPWISTNFAAQWCLNVIVVLAFIREYLPENLEEADKLVEEMMNEGFRKA